MRRRVYSASFTKRNHGKHRGTVDLPNEPIPGTGTGQALQALPLLGLSKRQRSFQGAFKFDPSCGWKLLHRRRRPDDRGVAQDGDCVEFQRWVGQDRFGEVQGEGN